jgi:enoyl-CoA hydratase/carnithine racemase
LKVGKHVPVPKFQALTIRTEGAVLFASIDNPPINLMGPALVSDLVSLIQFLNSTEEYRVVVFSSANPDFFIAHFDIVKAPEYRVAAARLTGEASAATLLRHLSEVKAVTIAQISGRVRGLGSEFVLACDMRFASRERAVFGQIEAGFGLVPGAGAVQYLAHLMGRGRTFEALLGANDYDGDLAERYGWVNRALPDDELEPFVFELANRIASFPREGLLAIKERINAITLASDADFRCDYELFGKLVRQAEPARRIRVMLERGMQQLSDTELNFGQALREFDK